MAVQIDDRVGELATLALSDPQNRRIAMLERHVNPQIYDKLQELFEREAVHPTEVQHVQSAEEAAALILQTDYLALLTKSGALAHFERCH